MLSAALTAHPRAPFRSDVIHMKSVYRIRLMQQAFAQAERTLAHHVAQRPGYAALAHESAPEVESIDCACRPSIKMSAATRPSPSPPRTMTAPPHFPRARIRSFAAPSENTE